MKDGTMMHHMKTLAAIEEDQKDGLVDARYAVCPEDSGDSDNNDA